MSLLLGSLFFRCSVYPEGFGEAVSSPPLPESLHCAGYDILCSGGDTAVQW